MYEVIHCVVICNSRRLETTQVVHPHNGGTCNFEREKDISLLMKLSPGYILNKNNN